MSSTSASPGLQNFVEEYREKNLHVQKLLHASRRSHKLPIRLVSLAQFQASPRHPKQFVSTAKTEGRKANEYIYMNVRICLGPLTYKTPQTQAR